MNEPMRNEIVGRFRGGASIRRIARSWGWPAAPSAGRCGEVEAPRGRCDGSRPRRRPQPARRLRAGDRRPAGAYPDITARRVLEELRQLGFTGGYTILRQRVRRVAPRAGAAAGAAVRDRPGAQAQMDYSTYDLDFTDEGRRRVHAFSYVLGYSRRQYLHFVEAQDFATTVREHVRAFEHLGGVAATCLYDNMKVVVSGYDGDEPVYNPRFLAFAAHYGFRPVACRPRRPQTKGKVERPFGYVESSLLGGRTFRGLEHLNETAAVVAGRGRRRARPPPDQAAAGRPPCRGTAAPDPAAGQAVRRRRGGLPHGRRRGVRVATARTSTRRPGGTSARCCRCG